LGFFDYEAKTQRPPTFVQVSPFTDKSIGGLSTTIWDNTKRLANLGHRVTVFTPSHNGEGECQHDGTLVGESDLGLKLKDAKLILPALNG
jgi:glycogen synthase